MHSPSHTNTQCVACGATISRETSCPILARNFVPDSKEFLFSWDFCEIPSLLNSRRATRTFLRNAKSLSEVHMRSFTNDQSDAITHETVTHAHAHTHTLTRIYYMRLKLGRLSLVDWQFSRKKKKRKRRKLPVTKTICAFVIGKMKESHVKSPTRHVKKLYTCYGDRESGFPFIMEPLIPLFFVV